MGSDCELGECTVHSESTRRRYDLLSHNNIPRARINPSQSRNASFQHQRTHILSAANYDSAQPMESCCLHSRLRALSQRTLHYGYLNPLRRRNNAVFKGMDHPLSQINLRGAEKRSVVCERPSSTDFIVGLRKSCRILSSATRIVDSVRTTVCQTITSSQLSFTGAPLLVNRTRSQGLPPRPSRSKKKSSGGKHLQAQVSL